MKKIKLFLVSYTIAAFFVSCNKEKEPSTCKEVPVSGGLTYSESTGTFNYETSGGGKITIAEEVLQLNHEGYANLNIQFWGGLTVNGEPQYSFNHENLNGKHMKDRVGSRRTIIFPDGAKITWVAEGEDGKLLSISIYENGEAHLINRVCGVLEYSAVNSTIAQQRDDAEADGETSTFEFDDVGLEYKNIYTENTPGNKVPDEYLIGTLQRSSPNSVNDHYDDPRLNHT